MDGKGPDAVMDSKGEVGAAAPYWLKFIFHKAAFSRVKGI